jgi:hypothetical protein
MAKSNIISTTRHGNTELIEVSSYVSLANLNKALEKHGILNHRHLTVQTIDGRWTAIFPASNITGGYLGIYSQHGFMTIG